MAYNLESIVKRVRELKLPLGQYVVVGGATLVAHGIRETRDIDIIVTPELFKQLTQNGWEFDEEYKAKWNRECARKDDAEAHPDIYLENAEVFLNVVELIEQAEIIDGIPFQPLEHLKMCKQDTGREKDLADVACIEEYLAITPR